MPRFAWRRWACLHALTYLIACFQGCGDPVARLDNAVRNPRDAYAFDEAIDTVNGSAQRNDAASLLIRCLNDDDGSVRLRAARALGRVYADKNLVVPALIEAWKDEAIRVYATESLGEIGPVDDRIISALVLSLKDENPAVRFAAVSAFFKVAPAGEEAVPALTVLLDDKHVSWHAAQALGRMSSKAKPAAPALVRLLKTADGYARLHAAEALWLIDQNTEVAVPALIASLRDPFLPIRRDAANILGAIGPRAAAAVPALVAARDYTPKPRPKRVASRPRDDSPPVAEEMPEEEFYPQVRRAAVESLSRIKKGALTNEIPRGH